jgi:hypothetical protein
MIRPRHKAIPDSRGEETDSTSFFETDSGLFFETTIAKTERRDGIYTLSCVLTSIKKNQFLKRFSVCLAVC